MLHRADAGAGAGVSTKQCKKTDRQIGQRDETRRDEARRGEARRGKTRDSQSNTKKDKGKHERERKSPKHDQLNDTPGEAGGSCGLRVAGCERGCVYASVPGRPTKSVHYGKKTRRYMGARWAIYIYICVCVCVCSRGGTTPLRRSLAWT
ncbi:hypothetical protein DFH11DRAFT_1195630 [Phellopilus nigrolimitatus]|nr:hypothetical protein DFH11DRAFT_1195630 [Phellopilus nigrolimitatus]